MARSSRRHRRRLDARALVDVGEAIGLARDAVDRADGVAGEEEDALVAGRDAGNELLHHHVAPAGAARHVGAPPSRMRMPRPLQSSSGLSTTRPCAAAKAAQASQRRC